MATTVEILGVHPVEADEPCHLVELIIHDSDGQIDFAAFTQTIPDEAPDNWQVPWDEILLNAAGDAKLDSSALKQNVRAAFFFHSLNVFRPLVTPFGDASLPEVSPRPDRLAFYEYESP